jgi:AcrR family transcriptional regulator
MSTRASTRERTVAGSQPRAKRAAGPKQPTTSSGGKRVATSRKTPVKKPYHHGDLREALLRAALEIVEAEGVGALSVREVARRAGVSPAAPFRHFPDKKALIAGIATDAMRSFVAFSEQAVVPPDATPSQRFRVLGIAYLDFALTHPARFRAMSDPEVAPAENDELRELRARYGHFIESRVADVVRASGGLQHQGPARLAGHALAYGLAHMLLDGMIPGTREEARAAAIAALDVLGPGIQPRPSTSR